MRLSEQVINTVQRMRNSGPMLNLADRPIMLINLLFMHQVISASENLMEEALQFTRNKALRSYLLGHRGEELDHAKWLREDLLTAGIDPDKEQLYRQAVELVGTQYYWIFHRNPNALLGYMAVLEGFPFPLDMLEALEQVHGKDLLRCLRYHAVHDQEHKVELFKTIDLVGDPEILNNAARTQFLLNEAFAQLC